MPRKSTPPTQLHSLNLWECLPVPRVPEGAEWAYNIVGGYRHEVVRSGHLAE